MPQTLSAAAAARTPKTPVGETSLTGVTETLCEKRRRTKPRRPAYRVSAKLICRNNRTKMTLKGYFGEMVEPSGIEPLTSCMPC
ncbi:hypothetical protein, partial [Novosphingobium lindaniclasticum]|uniref:hypothetical protein n=1 Tax=Novosphingobium lindaniclasticum TaxID=1329895 RepID=UPI001F300C0D